MELVIRIQTQDEDICASTQTVFSENASIHLMSYGVYKILE